MRRHGYEIQVSGILGTSWTKWFDGLSIRQENDELSGQAFTTLSGSMDQAALHGVLSKIRDLGLPLLAIRRMDGAGVPGSDEA